MNIKNFILFFIVSLFQFYPLYSQTDLEQLHHKYLVVQAWNIVRQQHSEVINSEMQNRMQFSPETYGDWWNTEYDGLYAWHKGKIISGAFREDEEDVVFDYDGLFNANVTNTHFWITDPSEGGSDNWKFSPPYGGNYENAYQKAMIMWNGKRYEGNSEWGALTLGRFFYLTYPFFVKIKYDNLEDAYRHPENVKVTHYYWEFEQKWYDEPEQPFFIPYMLENSNLSETEIRAYLDRAIWETVGRIAHLIADMGVPAHSHGSWHTSEIYEKEYMPSHFQNWSWTNAMQQGGLVDIIYKQNPLKYSMYLTNQVADRFAGNQGTHPFISTIPGNYNYQSYYGNDNYGEILFPIYQGINVPTNPENITWEYCYEVAQTSYVFSVRTTAGFLWYVYYRFFSSLSVPANIDIYEPGNCWGIYAPVIMNSSTHTLPCHFKIIRENDNRQYEYEIYFKQDGTQHYLGKGTAIANTDAYFDCIINSAHGPCLNKPAEIQIYAHPEENTNDISTKSVSFIPYYTTDIICNSTLKAAINCDNFDFNNQNISFNTQAPCYGNHSAKRYKVYKQVYFNSDQIVQIDANNTAGFDYNKFGNFSFYTGNKWAGIENQTPTSARLFTYVYEIPS
ncbi:MAG: hypothetical protein WC358_03620, partial [Ignavibacteria bacterium]